MRYIDGRNGHSPGQPASPAAGNGRARYTDCYNRLYPRLKAGTLDFANLSAQMGCKERRIRESLWFRLGSGEVRTLFGLESHVCYLCSKPVPIPKEAVCIGCLETIETFGIEANLTAPTATQAPDDPPVAIVAGDNTIQAAVSSASLSGIDQTPPVEISEEALFEELEAFFAEHPEDSGADNAAEDTPEKGDGAPYPALKSPLTIPRHYGFERVRSTREKSAFHKN